MKLYYPQFSLSRRLNDNELCRIFGTGGEVQLYASRDYMGAYGAARILEITFKFFATSQPSVEFYIPFLQ